MRRGFDVGDSPFVAGIWVPGSILPERSSRNLPIIPGRSTLIVWQKQCATRRLAVTSTEPDSTLVSDLTAWPFRLRGGSSWCVLFPDMQYRRLSRGLPKFGL